VTRPEAKARQLIDRQLDLAGWIVQDARHVNISAGPSGAIREFPLKTGSADYLFYLGGQAAGGIEAKPEGHSLTGVEIQSARYTDGINVGDASFTA
jgi:type I restriction enzyme R subunit